MKCEYMLVEGFSLSRAARQSSLRVLNSLAKDGWRPTSLYSASACVLLLEREAVATALRAAEGAREWLPIETVPDDGEFLVYWPGYKLDENGDLTTIPTGNGLIGAAERLQGQWNGEPEALNAVGGYFGDDWEYGEPTHWMRLPEPPATDEREK